MNAAADKKLDNHSVAVVALQLDPCAAVVVVAAALPCDCSQEPYFVATAVVAVAETIAGTGSKTKSFDSAMLE